MQETFKKSGVLEPWNVFSLVRRVKTFCRRTGRQQLRWQAEEGGGRGQKKRVTFLRVPFCPWSFSKFTCLDFSLYKPKTVGLFVRTSVIPSSLSLVEGVPSAKHEPGVQKEGFIVDFFFPFGRGFMPWFKKKTKNVLFKLY